MQKSNMRFLLSFCNDWLRAKWRWVNLSASKSKREYIDEWYEMWNIFTTENDWLNEAMWNVILWCTNMGCHIQ